MDANRLENVKQAFNAYLKTNIDSGFQNFLKSMNNDELETYFYFETHRANQYIQEISLDKENPVTINDLKDKSAKNKLPLGHVRSNRAIKSLIKFWDMFGNLPKPSLELKQSIIDKHNQFIRELTQEEKEFVINC